MTIGYSPRVTEGARAIYLILPAVKLVIVRQHRVHLRVQLLDDFMVHATSALGLAGGGSVIECPSPLSVREDAYDHSCG